MIINNPFDITDIIKRKLMLYNTIPYNLALTRILHDCTFQLGSKVCYKTLFLPIIGKYLYIEINANIDNGTVSLSLWCSNPDNSNEYKDAKNIIEYLDALKISGRGIMKQDNDLIYNYIDNINDITDVINQIVNFVTDIVKIMNTFFIHKNDIDWDNIVGMKKGSIICLTDDDKIVTDNNNRPVIAEYIGNGKINSRDIIGTPDDLASLLINNYGNRESRVYYLNGNEHWSFNGKRICDCDIEIK